MPQTVLRPQFGHAPHPVHQTGFEPIIVDLSRRRKKRMLLKVSKLALFVFGAVTIVAFVYFNRAPDVAAPSQAQAPQPNKEIAGPAYFIPAPADEFPPPQVEEVKAEKPHLTLPPIPQEALSPEAAELVPILEKLPVGQDFAQKAKARRAENARLSISVTRDSHLAKHDQYVREAANAVRNGKHEDAIRLYSAALKAVPDDRDAAYNLTALLLQKASFLDQSGKGDAAIPAYEQVIKVWGEKDGIAASVRQRLEWLKHKPGPLVAPVAYTETMDNGASE